MKKYTSLLLHLILLVIVVLELLGRLNDNINMEYAVKPLIMVWMATFFLTFRKKKAFTIPILLAFFFSWTGDMFLMFSGGYENEMFFYLGVAGFLLAQLTYIYVFSKRAETGVPGLVQRKLFWSLPFLAFVAGLFLYLLPDLEGVMKVVILIYALSLMFMSMLALNRKHRVAHLSYILVFVGSILFLLSDSMIAINKFSVTIPEAGFWIMLSYMAAQYLITRGLTEEC